MVITQGSVFDKAWGKVSHSYLELQIVYNPQKGAYSKTHNLKKVLTSES